MFCWICDRCKEPIDGKAQLRLVRCTRPLRRPPPPPQDRKDGYRDYDDYRDEYRRDGEPPFNPDVIWEYELCADCAREVEEFAKAKLAQEEEEEESGVPGVGGVPGAGGA